MDTLFRVLSFVPFCAIMGGCSSTPPKHTLTEPIVTTVSAAQQAPVLVTNYRRPEEMDRAEIIDSVKQCQDARMKPVIIYVYQSTEFGKIKTPVNVHCETYRLER